MRNFVIWALSACLLAAQQPVPVAMAKDSPAKEALDLSGKWMSGGSTPTVGPDGRAVYAFGAGLVTTVCAPERVCLIELQAGEKLTDEPQIGDSVRWMVAPVSYGTGENKTTMIALKPTAAKLETNLVILTDRRSYFLRLVSDETQFVARTAFRYAESDNAGAWRKHAAEEERDRAERERMVADNLGHTVLMPAIEAADRLDFNYEVTVEGKKAVAWKPTKVWADKVDGKTFFRLPAEVKFQEAPGIWVVNAQGKPEVTNWRPVEGPAPTYMVDRLADHFQLRLGTGKKGEVVDVRHGTKERS